MPINPDGTATITNTKTGEVKTIQPSEFGQYGIQSSTQQPASQPNPVVDTIKNLAESATGDGGVASPDSLSRLAGFIGGALGKGGAFLGGAGGYGSGEALQSGVYGLFGDTSPTEQKIKDAGPAQVGFGPRFKEAANQTLLKPLLAGGEQAVYSAKSPKAIADLPLIPRVGANAVIGTGRGLAGQVIDNILKGKPLTENLGTSAAISGGVEAALPELGNLLKGAKNQVEGPVIQRKSDIAAMTEEAGNTVKRKMQGVIQRVIGEKPELQQLATKYNLLPMDEAGSLATDVSPSAVANKALDAANTVKGQLSDAVSASGDKATTTLDSLLSDFRKNISKFSALTGQQKDAIEQNFINILGVDNSQGAISSLEDIQQAKQSGLPLPDMQQSKVTNVSLPDIQQAKETMSRAQWFTKNPTTEIAYAKNAAYTTLKDFAETLAAQSGTDVRALNQEIQGLHEIANNAQSVPLSAETPMAVGQAQDEFSKQMRKVQDFSKAPLKANPLIEGTIASLVGLGGKALLGNAGLGLAGMYGLYGMGKGVSTNPQMMEALGSILGKGAQGVEAASPYLRQILQQIMPATNSPQQ